jgi:zinc protease
MSFLIEIPDRLPPRKLESNSMGKKIIPSLLNLLAALICLSIALAAPLPVVAAEVPVFRTINDNGLVLLVKPNDSKDIVAITVLLRISVFDQTDQKVGIRTLLAHLLHKKICSELSPSGIRVTELMGVVSSMETTPDYMVLSFVTTPRHYKKMLELITKGLSDCSFTDAMFKKEKGLFLEEMKGGKGGFSQIYDIFLQNFYRYHPYRSSEEVNIKGLESVDKSRLESFAREKLSSDRIIIAVAGNVTNEEVKNLVAKNFSSITPKKSSKVEVQWEPQSTEKEIFLSSLSQMSWLLMGFPAPAYGSPDYPAMKVMNTILAEGLNSRLWNEVREKRGLAYQLGSFFPELDGPSHLLIYVITEPQYVILARRLILSEIEKIKSMGVSSRELQDAKIKISGTYLLSRESSKGQALDMASSEIIGGQYSLDVNMQKRVEEVTSNDVKRVITHYFVDPTLLVVRPPGHFYIDWFR